MLDTGSSFPPIAAKGLDGSAVAIDQLTAGHWSAVLFYRGHW